MKKLIKDFIPPIVLKILRKAGFKSKKKLIEGKELGANWYDERYKAKSTYHDHYTKSPYYFT